MKREFTQEHKDKIRDSKVGVKLSTSHRSKISEGRKKFEELVKAKEQLLEDLMLGNMTLEQFRERLFNLEEKSHEKKHEGISC